MNTRSIYRRLRKSPQKCTLLDLPAELRLIIYSYIYSQTVYCYLSFSDGSLRYRRPIGKLQKKILYKRQDHHRAAVLLTSKLIAHEATPLFYQSIDLTVCFIDTKAWDHSHRWRTMSVEHLQLLAEQVKRVQLKYSAVSAKDRTEALDFILDFIRGLRWHIAVKPMNMWPGELFVERETKFRRSIDPAIEERRAEEGEEDVVYNTLQEVKDYINDYFEGRLF